MTQKSKTNSKDTTSKKVKNTKTDKNAESDAVLHWYHIVATVIVLALALIAVLRILSHYSLTLFGSEYSIKYTSGCTTTIDGPVEPEASDYRYAGIKEGDLIGANGIEANLSEAYIEIVELGDKKAKVKIRDYSTGEWRNEEINYGEESFATTDLIFDCVPAIRFTINK